MVGRAGQDMLQAYDSVDNVPSVAASDAGPSHLSLDPARLSHAPPEISFVEYQDANGKSARQTYNG